MRIWKGIAVMLLVGVLDCLGQATYSRTLNGVRVLAPPAGTPGIGQGVFWDGTSWGWSSAAASGAIYPSGTANAYGDSMTSAAASWVTNVAQATGWGITNRGVASSQMADAGQIDRIFELTVATNAQSLLLSGYNDMRFVGTGDALGLNGYSNTLAAGMVWLGLPETQKIRGQNSSVAYVGTWTTQPGSIYGGALGKYTSQNGATATITNVIGRTIYVCLLGYSSAGSASATITIDGVSQGTVALTEQTTTTGNGRTWFPILLRYEGLSEGAHTIVVTAVTAGSDVHLNWVAGSGAAGGIKGANVFLGDCLRMSSTGYAAGTPYNVGSDAAVALFNSTIQKVSTDLARDGLNVYRVRASEAYEPTTDVGGDHVHPSAAGQAKITAAFLAQINPLSRRRDEAPVDSAGMEARLSDEEGSGKVVFNTLPDFVTAIRTPAIRPVADGTTGLQVQSLGGGLIANFDTSNARLGLNLINPSTRLDVRETTAATVALTIQSTNNAAGDVATESTFATARLQNNSTSANAATGIDFNAGGQNLGGLFLQRNGSGSDAGLLTILTSSNNTPRAIMSSDNAQRAMFPQGIQLLDLGGDPASLTNGMIWRNGSKIYARQDGATIELGAAGGGGAKAVQAATDDNSIEVDADTYDIIELAELSQTTNFVEPTGTASNGDTLEIWITSTTARSITFDEGDAGDYDDSDDLPFPETTSGGGKTDHLIFRWIATKSRWHLAGKNFGF